MEPPSHGAFQHRGSIRRRSFLHSGDIPMNKRMLVLLAASLATGCTTIGPGRTGVLWRAANGTQQQIYGEGKHMVAPWNEMFVYDLRTMSHDEALNVIASNGLEIKLDSTIR